MGDEGDFWNDVKKAQRKEKDHSLNRFSPILQEAVRLGIAKQIQYYQYRVGIVDFYPMSQTWIQSKPRKRGSWRSERELKNLINQAQSL